MEHVFEEKDLGVTIDYELGFEVHISNKVQVDKAIVGLIWRSFSVLNCEWFKTMYTAFVCPHLEYTQSIWAPHLARNITTLENVQICVTNLVDGLVNLEYLERLKPLNLPSLVFRRRRGNMIEIYKHFHIYDKTTISPSIHPREHSSRKHGYQLQYTHQRMAYGEYNLTHFIAARWKHGIVYQMKL